MLIVCYHAPGISVCLCLSRHWPPVLEAIFNLECPEEGKIASKVRCHFERVHFFVVLVSLINNNGLASKFPSFKIGRFRLFTPPPRLPLSGAVFVFEN